MFKLYLLAALLASVAAQTAQLTYTEGELYPHYVNLQTGGTVTLGNIALVGDDEQTESICVNGVTVAPGGEIDIEYDTEGDFLIEVTDGACDEQDQDMPAPSPSASAVPQPDSQTEVEQPSGSRAGAKAKGKGKGKGKGKKGDLQGPDGLSGSGQLNMDQTAEEPSGPRGKKLSGKKGHKNQARPTQTSTTSSTSSTSTSTMSTSTSTPVFGANLKRQEVSPVDMGDMDNQNDGQNNQNNGQNNEGRSASNLAIVEVSDTPDYQCQDDGENLGGDDTFPEGLLRTGSFASSHNVTALATTLGGAVALVALVAVVIVRRRNNSGYVRL